MIRRSCTRSFAMEQSFFDLAHDLELALAGKSHTRSSLQPKLFNQGISENLEDPLRRVSMTFSLSFESVKL